MKRVVISAALAALGAGLLASAADAPEPVRAPVTNPGSISTALLPADPARALVIRTCVVCHPAELVIAKKRTVETWDRLISKMVDYGARADDDQQVEILTYFASYFLGTDTSIGAPAPVKAEPQH
jgi:hypothetical protein